MNLNKKLYLEEIKDKQMKTLKFTLLWMCLIVFTAIDASAHALWIETASAGSKGTAHDVKIYYGEFAAGERDVPEKWYSDVKDFSLWLVAPDGQKTKLETVAGAAFYSSSFTPEKDGVYTLMVSHEAAELGGTTKYHFISSAHVAVGKTTQVDAGQNANVLKVYPENQEVFKKNKSVKLYAQLNGQPLANKSVSIASSSGWTKEFKTDSKGMIEFSPLWSGRYVAEAQHYTETNGQHNGKDFHAAWIGSTFSFEVK